MFKQYYLKLVVIFEKQKLQPGLYFRSISHFFHNWFYFIVQKLTRLIKIKLLTLSLRMTYEASFHGREGVKIGAKEKGTSSLGVPSGNRNAPRSPIPCFVDVFN